MAIDLFPAELDTAAGLPAEPHDYLGEFALPVAVDSCDAEDLAVSDFQRHVTEPGYARRVGELYVVGTGRGVLFSRSLSLPSKLV